MQNLVLRNLPLRSRGKLAFALQLRRRSGNRGGSRQDKAAGRSVRTRQSTCSLVAPQSALLRKNDEELQFQNR